MPSILSCLCCERESAKFTGLDAPERGLCCLAGALTVRPLNEATSEFASSWLSNGTYHAFGEMLRTNAARQNPASLPRWGRHL